MSDEIVNRIIKDLEKGERVLDIIEVPEEDPWCDFLGIGCVSPCRTVNNPCDKNVFDELLKERYGLDWGEVEEIMDVLVDKMKYDTWDASFYLMAVECAENGCVPVKVTHYGDYEWELFACLTKDEYDRVYEILDKFHEIDDILWKYHNDWLEDEEMKNKVEELIEVLGIDPVGDIIDQWNEIKYNPVENSELLERAIEWLKKKT